MMKLHINKHSEVPVHQQLREQIIFLIGAGELSVGQSLPSVRECQRRYGVHKNTVARVYKDLVREGWLVSRRGRPLVVVEHAKATKENASADSLDDVIDRTIQLAQKSGYSLQQLAARLRERLLAEPPDHLLIVEPERGMGELMREEIRDTIGFAPETCSISTLQQNPGMAIGAVLLTPHYLVDGLKCIPTAYRNVVPISYVPMEHNISIVSSLSQPSTLGLLSVSAAGLKNVSGLVGGLVGDLHSFQLFLMESRGTNKTPVRQRFQFRRFTPEEYSVSLVRGFAVQTREPRVASSTTVRGDVDASVADQASMLSERDLQAMDLLFCDSITYKAVKHPRRIKYQLISDESLHEIATASRSLDRSVEDQHHSS